VQCGKVAKYEAQTMEVIHMADIRHLEAPLALCVDVRCADGAVMRVQVFSFLPLEGGDSLRFGSADGGRT